MKNTSKHKYILGIQCFADPDSGASIIKTNGEEYEYVAISEERLIRKKYSYTFPLHSIKYCMDHFKIKALDDIDLLVSDIIREPKWHRSSPSFNVKEFDYIKKKLNYSEKKIVQIGHHLAHASSVYYTSGFKNSAILIMDGNGTDLETNSFFEGKNSKINLVDNYKARGIGELYTTCTKNWLNLGVGGEGKTMGLAPYGNKGKPILDFSKVRFEGIITDYSSILKRQPFNDILVMNDKKIIEKCLIDIPQRKTSDDIMGDYWTRLAFDVQQETERCFIHLGKEIEKRIKSKNICMAGGVALNSVANQKLFDATKFEEIFVFPACSDTGVPLGLALWGLYNSPKIIKKPKKIKKLLNAYTGIKYSSEYTSAVLKKYKIKSKPLVLKKLAKELSNGKIAAWHQGGSEYGPRALGNRSILADSRNPKMRDQINEKVKHRGKYRPFAPAVLVEDFKKFFELKNESPFMLLVAKIKNPELIPAVSHVDGTARVQTVSRKQNKKYYDLIYEFKKITGIGCILNTSFNDAGEPIVETPEDAIISFSNMKIDYLVLGDQIIEANDIDKSLNKKMTLDREKKINENQKKSLALMTSNYNLNEKKDYFKIEEKKAYWNAIEKPLYDLKDKINFWTKEKKKIILYGTYDHTKLLTENVNNFQDLDIIGFTPYININDDYYNLERPKLPFTEFKDIKEIYDDNTVILISSYEFSYDIEKKLETDFPSAEYYKIYTGYSRNLSYNFKIRKN
jgi:carbamoyltransferase